MTENADRPPLLTTRNLAKHYGGIRAVDGVDCAIPEGAIYAVIGPNGAGKTTFFNCLGGVVKPTSGTIEFLGEPIGGIPSHRIAARGIARTWQTIRLFEHMTVLENAMVGCHTRGKSGVLSSIFGFPSQRREERRLRDEAMEQLTLMKLERYAESPVSALPFLYQRRVEMARALAARPRLLLLDEPAAGLNTRETAELGETIRDIRDGGVTVILVEHDMSLVMSISDRVLVLDHGVPIAEGAPREIQNDERVIAVYLGTEDICEAELDVPLGV
jgi:ABC-type branched-subunit amino acid transport system ATPase component